jgi:hypothetical protein
MNMLNCGHRIGVVLKCVPKWRQEVPSHQKPCFLEEYSLLQPQYCNLNIHHYENVKSSLFRQFRTRRVRKVKDTNVLNIYIFNLQKRHCG